MSAPLGNYKYVGSLFAEAALCYSYVDPVFELSNQ